MNNLLNLKEAKTFQLHAVDNTRGVDLMYGKDLILHVPNTVLKKNLKYMQVGKPTDYLMFTLPILNKTFFLSDEAVGNLSRRKAMNKLDGAYVSAMDETTLKVKFPDSRKELKYKRGALNPLRSPLFKLAGINLSYIKV